MNLNKREKVMVGLVLDDDEKDVLAALKEFYNCSKEALRIMYFQGSVDFNGSRLNIGRSVIFVYGRTLREGVIEHIEPFAKGFALPRIKIKGIKRNIDSHLIIQK